MNHLSNIKTKPLKYYIYLYSHPITNEVFYVGKGKGNRFFSYLDEKIETDKVKYFNYLKKQNLKPKIKILTHGIEDSDVAQEVESSIIDMIGIHNLTNQVRDSRRAPYGWMSLSVM